MSAARVARDTLHSSTMRSPSARRAAFSLTILLLPGIGLLASGCDEAQQLMIPTVYVVAGQVGDPTSNPFTPLAGATVVVETAPEVSSVQADADGNFILQGVPLGTHRLRAELAGRRTTISVDLTVDRNLADVGLPLFTDAQIDSILAARTAPPWDRATGLFGVFALRSTGVPLGDATVGLTPDPGGTKVQTGQGEDPIVWVNASPGATNLTVMRTGFTWRNPIPLQLRAGTVTFGVPRALPNLTGFLFADRLTGAPIPGASVTVESGPSRPSTTTDVIGQFRLQGIEPGTYTLRFDAPGFLPSLTFPQPTQEDTTLSYVAVHPDTLAAWAASQGAGAPASDRGHLLADLRAAVGGAPLNGAFLETFPSQGERIQQSVGRPALLLNLPPGTYTVIVRAFNGTELHRDDVVTVQASTVTAVRYDLE
jgi:hypothetical protein